MSTDRSRRRFLRAAGLGAMTMASHPLHAAVEPASPKPAQTAIPRWRGFNLLHFFQALSRDERGSGAIQEDDCRWIRDWGFDFIRIPMDYWLWVDSDWQKTRELHPDDVFRIKESALSNRSIARSKWARHSASM